MLVELPCPPYDAVTMYGRRETVDLRFESYGRRITMEPQYPVQPPLSARGGTKSIQKSQSVDDQYGGQCGAIAGAVTVFS